MLKLLVMTIPLLSAPSEDQWPAYAIGLSYALEEYGCHRKEGSHMRSFRVLALTVVVAVFLVAPAAFAKVCHPKKPVTCNASAFSSLAASSVASPAATTPQTTSAKPKAPAKVQHAMLCGPWVHWMCTANPLV